MWKTSEHTTIKVKCVWGWSKSYLDCSWKHLPWDATAALVLNTACVAVPHNINGSLYCPMVAWRLHCVELQIFFTLHGKLCSLNPNDLIRAKTSYLLPFFLRCTKLGLYCARTLDFKRELLPCVEHTKSLNEFWLEISAAFTTIPEVGLNMLLSSYSTHLCKRCSQDCESKVETLTDSVDCWRCSAPCSIKHLARLWFFMSK